MGNDGKIVKAEKIGNTILVVMDCSSSLAIKVACMFKKEIYSQILMTIKYNPDTKTYFLTDMSDITRKYIVPLNGMKPVTSRDRDEILTYLKNNPNDSIYE